jgi:hypothetical protein
MSTSRSDAVHEKWRESTEKFDYFILGVVGALCAYISQTYKPERIGLNPGTLDLLALLVLVLGAVFGFRRIEMTNLATMINQRVLHSNERRGALVSVVHKGPRVNTETGEVYTPEYASQEVAKLTKLIELHHPKLESAQRRAQRYYKLRNAFTLTGFLMLLSAKLYSAYV